MRSALKASLLLNLGLVAVLIFILVRQDGRTNGMLPVSEAGGKTIRDGETAPPVFQGVEAKPFEWSQVESTDYRAYIANLRRVGCPEQTIRDIITADLRALYGSKRDALQRQLIGTDPPATGSVARHELESAMEALGKEETATLAALLGPEISSARTAENAPAASRPERIKPESSEASVPLVFQQVEPGALKLSDRQIDAINNMQQWFVDQLGGPEQDPNDPAYKERWLKTQPQMNDMMRGMIGVNAFEDYQLAARASQQKTQESR